MNLGLWHRGMVSGSFCPAVSTEGAGGPCKNLQKLFTLDISRCQVSHGEAGRRGLLFCEACLIPKVETPEVSGAVVWK